MFLTNLDQKNHLTINICCSFFILCRFLFCVFHNSDFTSKESSGVHMTSLKTGWHPVSEVICTLEDAREYTIFLEIFVPLYVSECSTTLLALSLILSRNYFIAIQNWELDSTRYFSFTLTPIVQLAVAVLSIYKLVKHMH